MQADLNNGTWMRNNRYSIIALAILFIYLSPNIFIPDKAKYLVHDNLDSNVLWYKNLAESGKMYAPSNEIIEKSLGGLPRGCYPSQYNFHHQLYNFFSPLVAYNLNIIFSHLLAFLCFLIFSRRYLFENGDEGMSVFVSLLYALLPLWPAGATTMATQPLLLWAFLNLQAGDKKFLNWLVVITVPFFTILVHANLFFIVLFGTLTLLYQIQKRQFNWRIFMAMFLYIIVSVLVEYRLFVLQFLEGFESHRTGVNHPSTLNLKGVVGVSLLHFVFGQYHFYSLQFPITLLLSVVAVILGVGKARRYLLAILAINYLVSLLFVLPNWIFLGEIFSNQKGLSDISLRFYSLAPLLWFVILALSVRIIITKYPQLRKRFIIPALVIFALFEFLSVNELDYFKSIYPENSFAYTYIRRPVKTHQTFNEYYRIKEFKMLRREVEPAEGFVVGIGVDPEVLQYNDYKTLDGYFFYYPKENLDRINKINRKEFDKVGLKGGNNRAYLYVDQLRRNKVILDSISLDFELLRLNGVTHVFSTHYIQNENLQQCKRFSLKYNPNQLIVYRITPKPNH